MKQKIFAILALLALAIAPALSDPVVAAATPPKFTLAQALRTAQAPSDGVALAVGADKTTLPAQASAPAPGGAITDGVEAFGMIRMSFGAVTAIAPRSMVVFNNDPGPPDLSTVLRPSDAFTQLAASLNDSQWAKLISANGIGVDDLDSDQQALWWALFPGRTLRIIPVPTGDMDVSKEQATDLTEDLPQAHIRVAQTVYFFGIDHVGDVGFAFTDELQPTPGAPLQWVTAPTPRKPPSNSLYGNLLRAVVANQPKPSDLKFDMPALQTPIALAGIQTVGDLTTRIGRATGLELYVDPHFSERSVLFLGTAKTATARDLVQALALCVAGTYRTVGPAYVLTKNLLGLAQTHGIWEVYDDKSLLARDMTRDQTQESLYQRRGHSQLSGFGDPLAMSADEHPDRSDPVTHLTPWIRFVRNRSFADLTSGQQAAAQQMLAQWRAAHSGKNAPDSGWKWNLEPNDGAQLIAPGFSQPIQMENLDIAQLLMPPLKVMEEGAEKVRNWQKQHVRKLKPDEKPTPPLADLLKKFPLRAVLAAPHSADEVKSIVKSMQSFGLNQLWLTVFADGQARIPSTPFAQPLDHSEDLLQAALDATKGIGISVYPVASLLNWGASPPQNTRDENVLGENSVVIAARAKLLDAVGLSTESTRFSGMWVSPFAPAVSQNLTALVKTLASRPGIGGLVARATDPPGYANSTDVAPVGFLGYTESARLGFLRARRADPLDIADRSYSRVDFSLPNWDDPKLEASERVAWSKYRYGADLWLLHRLFDSVEQASPAGHPPTIFFQMSGGDDFQGLFEGGVFPPQSWPVDGSLPDAKPNIHFDTVLLDSAYAPVGLAGTLHNDLKDDFFAGLAFDIIPADGGMGAAGFADFAKSAAKVKP